MQIFVTLANVLKEFDFKTENMFIVVLISHHCNVFTVHFSEVT